MSIFDSIHGGGDIWSISGIQFGSPIRDILDKETFTLEELLQEDELLQEVKSKNEQLIAFLSQHETIEKLLDYITKPCEPGADELRLFKYPYMSCEVFCCEAPEILQALVESDDNYFLRKIFSIFDQEGPLDNYLAGYFEKVLEMLFRKATIAIISFVNSSGNALFLQFLKHIDNYSITQIVQRLLLPHIPFSMNTDFDAIAPEDRHLYQCNWSFADYTCTALCQKMLESENLDVPSHISDLLITVLQLSPPDTVILTHLCDPPCLEMLIRSAFAQGALEDTATLDAQVGFLAPSSVIISLAAISVLESLISRLCEPVMPYEEAPGGMNMVQMEETAAIMRQVKENIDKVCSSIQPFIPQLATHLRGYVEANPCGTIKAQTKSTFPRVGHRCLQLVKLVESLIRIMDPEIDSLLCETGVLSATLDLMFAYELNSLLHLSVHRIVLMIIEGGEGRKATLHHILIESGLLNRIMQTFSDVPAHAAPPNPEGDVESSLSTKSASTVPRVTSPGLSNARRPILGHLIQIAHAVNSTLHVQTEDEDQKEDSQESSFEITYNPTDSSTKPETQSKATTSSSKDSEGGDVSTEETATAASSTSAEAKYDSGDGLYADEMAGEADVNGATKSTRNSSLKMIIGDVKLMNEWDAFTSDKLHPALILQTAFQPKGIVAGEENFDDGSLQAQATVALMEQHLRMQRDAHFISSEEYGDDDDDDDDDDDIAGRHHFFNVGNIPDFHNFQSMAKNNSETSDVTDFADFRQFPTNFADAFAFQGGHSGGVINGEVGFNPFQDSNESDVIVNDSNETTGSSNSTKGVDNTDPFSSTSSFDPFDLN